MKKGFSFIELIVVVVIAGSITALAIPTYGNYIEKSRGRNAEANLKIIHQMEKRYRLENGEGKYWVCGTAACPLSTVFVCNSAACAPKLIGENLFNTYIRDPYFSYTIVRNVALATYTAQARRIGTGPCGNRVMWIDKNSSDVVKNDAAGCAIW